MPDRPLDSVGPRQVRETPGSDPAAMNAAGWHLCLDVLDGTLTGAEPARVVGEAALDHGWESLRDAYAELLGG